MTPPTVNAYYSAQKNHMVFPAGILQPPFFNPRASVPVNLGGMGMVVGHELTHGFDDKGSKYDAQGNLANWWSEQDQGRFKAKTDCIADQYGAYETLLGVKLNGRLTLGENIADGGGVKLAFHAYRAMRKDAAEVQQASGFTEDQQFFLGVGPGVVLQAERRGGEAPGQDRPALAAAVPCQRLALQSPRVRRRVLVPGGRPHAPGQRLLGVVPSAPGGAWIDRSCDCQERPRSSLTLVLMSDRRPAFAAP